MKAKLLLFAASLFVTLAYSQTPDCNPPSFFLGVSSSAPLPQGYDNRALGCQTWTVFYVADAPGFTLSFQSSLGENAPASYGPYTGTMVSSSASFGTATVGVATFTSLSATPGSSVDTPWVQVNVTGLVGNTIRIGFYGYRTGPTGGTGGGGGGGGGTGCPNPCPVVGTAAAGAPPSGDPVQTAGSDGTDIRTLRTDATGHPIVVGGAASGAVQVGNSVPVSGNDGTDVRTLHTDTSGNLDVNVQGTIPVSGACPNPCPVEGVDAAGAAPTVPPLAVAGFDGTNNQRIKTDTSGDLLTVALGVGTFTGNQQMVTASAVNLGTAAAKTVCVEALAANAIPIFIGPVGVTISTGFPLAAGQPACMAVTNTNLVYVIASTTGASVAWFLLN